jgi:hypothetical protein
MTVNPGRKASDPQKLPLFERLGRQDLPVRNFYRSHALADKHIHAQRIALQLSSMK